MQNVRALPGAQHRAQTVWVTQINAEALVRLLYPPRGRRSGIVVGGEPDRPHLLAFCGIGVHNGRYTPTLHLQSTDNEMIHARNASPAAMHSYASGSNVRYYPT
jgi:hypothetical protein